MRAAAAVAAAVARVVVAAAVVAVPRVAAAAAPAATVRAATAGARRPPAVVAAARAAEIPMTAPPADALLAGATGLVGQALLRGWAGPGTLHLLVRRPLQQTPAGCRVHVVDFGQLSALPTARDAYCTLGTTIEVAGSQAAFRAVDFDAVLAFARAARAAGVQRFAVVSALGADARSRNFYSRVKGEAEAALAELGFGALLIARPSLLLGDRAALGQPDRRGERIGQALSRHLGGLIPRAWRPIEADVVARALLNALPQAGPGTTVLDSAALQRLGR